MARSGQRSTKGNDHTVYREFGASTSVATERALPDRPVAQQALRVHLERKGRGGKTVSVVSGFQCREETLVALLKQLKTHCGSGGTVKGTTIELQGDHRQKLVTWLTQQGYTVKLSGG